MQQNSSICVTVECEGGMFDGCSAQDARCVCLRNGADNRVDYILRRVTEIMEKGGLVVGLSYMGWKVCRLDGAV